MHSPHLENRNMQDTARVKYFRVPCVFIPAHWHHTGVQGANLTEMYYVRENFNFSIVEMRNSISKVVLIV